MLVLLVVAFLQAGATQQPQASAARSQSRIRSVLEAMFPWQSAETRQIFPWQSDSLRVTRVCLASLPGVPIFLGTRPGEHVSEQALVALLKDSSVIPVGSRQNRQVLLNVYRAELVREPIQAYVLDIAVLEGITPFGVRVVNQLSDLPPWAREEAQRLGLTITPPVLRTYRDNIKEFTAYVWADSLWRLRVSVTQNPWYDTVEAQLLISTTPG